MRSLGCTPLPIHPQLYVLFQNGLLILILSCHVDDIKGAGTDEAKIAMLCVASASTLAFCASPSSRSATLLHTHLLHPTGELGPSTIVGSAAFNMLMITAVCVVAIPNGGGRNIKELPVFYITGAHSRAHARRCARE